MRYMLLTIFTVISNTYDAVHTGYYLHAGKITEANPIVRAIIEDHGIFGMMFFKLIIVNTLILILFFNNEIKVARIGIYLVSFIYFLLMLWQSQIFFI